MLHGGDGVGRIYISVLYIHDPFRHTKTSKSCLPCIFMKKVSLHNLNEIKFYIKWNGCEIHKVIGVSCMPPNFREYNTCNTRDVDGVLLVFHTTKDATLTPKYPPILPSISHGISTRTGSGVLVENTFITLVCATWVGLWINVTT